MFAAGKFDKSPTISNKNYWNIFLFRFYVEKSLSAPSLIVQRTSELEVRVNLVVRVSMFLFISVLGGILRRSMIEFFCENS